MDLLVAHLIELHVAGQHALGLAVDLHVEQDGEKAALVQQLGQQPLLDGDQVGILFGAVDHAGHPPGATRCPGWPLPGPFPRLRGKLNDVRHCPTPSQVKRTRHPAVSPRSPTRSEEHTSELQSLMRISYAVFCLKKKNST